MSRYLIALSALLLTAGTASFAQDDGSTQESLSPLQRWERLKPEEQERMRGRFERWGRLSEEQREEYQRRSEERGRASKEALKILRPEDRAKFDLLDSETKEDVLRELTHMRILERGHRLRGMFPKECQERLDSAGPEERKAILDQFRREDLHKAGKRALRELGNDLGLSEAEIENIQSMKPDRRHEELLKLKRRAVELRRQAGGDSAVLAEGEWERIKELPPREFAREWFDHRERADWRQGDKLKRQLHELLKPTLDELVEASRVPEAERRALLASLARKRIEGFVAANGGVPAELKESFFGGTDQEAMTRLRRYLRPSKGEGRRGARGPKEGGERGGRHKRGEGGPDERRKPGRPGPGGPPPPSEGGPPPTRGGPRGPGRAIR